MKNTLIILSHPDIENSKYNKALVNCVENLDNVTLHHLDNSYGVVTNNFDIEKEQKLLMENDRIIFQFPLYWYSSPAILKSYQDEVFTHGFAYGKTGNKLHGKEFKIVSTIAGEENNYQNENDKVGTIEELFKPFQAVASSIGLTYTKSFLLYGVSSMRDDFLLKKQNEYKEMLLSKNW